VVPVFYGLNKIVRAFPCPCILDVLLLLVSVSVYVEIPGGGLLVHGVALCNHKGEHG